LPGLRSCGSHRVSPAGRARFAAGAPLPPAPGLAPARPPSRAHRRRGPVAAGAPV